MKFSIIIPCYKVERYIRECLNSVLVQSVSDWEAICVDDGSPDNTGIILDEYALYDSRIKVIHQENGGLSAARNAALKIAQGEWLYYLDSDDLMPPNVMKDALETLKVAPDADLIWGRMTKFKDGEICQWYRGGGDATVVDVSMEFQPRYFGCYFPQYIYRRSTFGDLRFVGDSWCEERPYFAKCMVMAKKVIEVDCAMYGFRIRGESITSSRMELRHLIGYLDATREILKILTVSRKKIDKSIICGFVKNWMEWVPYRIFRELQTHDRRKAWQYWFSCLSEAEVYGKMLGGWFRWVIVLYIRIRLPLLPLFMGAFPHWLKLHGIHR